MKIMNELDEIKNRIHNRKGKSRDVNVELVEVEKKYSKPSKFYKISMCCLVIMAMFLSVAIYARKDENGKFLKDKLGININFASFNKTLNKLLNFRAVNTVSNGDKLVANVPSYIHTGNDMYISNSNEVKSIDDGIVTYIYEDETGYLVIVENDSGFRSVYSNLLDVSVKVNDRIYFDSIIGNVEESVKIIFSKNNQVLTYEQVVELLQ